MSKWKWDTAHGDRRCGHAWCSDCKTRRGRRQGNRNDRRRVREIMRQMTGRSER